MKNAVAVEVNKIEWKKQSATIAVVEAKMLGESPTGDEIYYYRYQWTSGTQLNGTSVLRRWFDNYERTAIPKVEWEALPIVKGNLPEEILDEVEPNSLV